jgi:hypothetical protein
MFSNVADAMLDLDDTSIIFFLVKKQNFPEIKIKILKFLQVQKIQYKFQFFIPLSWVITN